MAMDQLLGWAGLIHPPKGTPPVSGCRGWACSPRLLLPHQVEVERSLLSSAPLHQVGGDEPQVTLLRV